MKNSNVRNGRVGGFRTSGFGFLSLTLFLPSVAVADDPPKAAPHVLKLLQPGKTLIEDPFDRQERPGRRLTRGPWVVKGGQAAVTQDDELFKKYKEHGPAIWYDLEFKDAIIRFEFRVSPACRQVVFTVNGKEGHVFRFAMQDSGTDVRAWDADHKPKRVADNGPPLPREKWVAVTVELAGEKAAVHIGDRYQVTVSDPSYAAGKAVVGLSHHYGSLQVRNFRVIQGNSK